MKKLFIYLLKKYTRTEEDRLEILGVIYDQVQNEYNEQTTFGNIYNFMIEFVISNPIIKQMISEHGPIELGMIKHNIDDAFNQGISIIKTQNKC